MRLIVSTALLLHLAAPALAQTSLDGVERNIGEMNRANTYEQRLQSDRLQNQFDINQLRLQRGRGSASSPPVVAPGGRFRCRNGAC